MACIRHPIAATRGKYCPACLLEQALAPMQEEPAANQSRFTLQLPLGETGSTAVFLVRTKGPPSRLLRLKIWRRPAADGFIDRFHRLQTELASWPVEDIDRPLAASVDGNGCPSVLSEFRRGVPILDRVGTGRLDREQACALLRPLVSLAHRAHSCGLTHGSIVPGNVIVETESGRAHLLDFGLTPLLTSRQDHLALAAADLNGFAALERRLTELPADPGPAGRL